MVEWTAKKGKLQTARPKVEIHNSMIPRMKVGNINTIKLPIHADIDCNESHSLPQGLIV